MISRSDEVTLKAYADAVDHLPSLTRLVFLLIRVKDLSYDDIAHRLSIESEAVEACLAEALYMLYGLLHGGPANAGRAMRY